ncbi:protein BCP1 [Pelomyxa schiedti]|nr:protein BCP1 [Pelomyxa schiedti]
MARTKRPRDYETTPTIKKPNARTSTRTRGGARPRAGTPTTTTRSPPPPHTAATTTTTTATTTKSTLLGGRTTAKADNNNNNNNTRRRRGEGVGEENDDHDDDDEEEADEEEDDDENEEEEDEGDDHDDGQDGNEEDDDDGEAASAAAAAERREESSSGGDDDDDFEVEFEFFNQRPLDFHSIKTLSANLLGVAFNCSELADMVCNANVGSVVKADGIDSEALGYITLLNLTSPIGCMTEIKDFILKFCGSARAKVEHAFSQPDTVGLVLNQRMMNLPIALIPPLHRMFFEEVEEQEGLDPATPKFQYYVLITSYLEPIAGTTSSPRGTYSKEDPGPH